MFTPPENRQPGNQSYKPDTTVRHEVQKILRQSEAFNALDAPKQQQLAHDMARVADYLARPDGFDGRKVGGVPIPAQAQSIFGNTDSKAADEASFDERMEAVKDIAADDFEAQAAREGAEVAGLLLEKVKFSEFVGGLIQNVFQSIVTSSMEQMEQYTHLIASVATSLKDFMDENVSENQGRDHMVDKFPDLFEIGESDWGGFDDESAGPKLKLRDGVDETDALQRVNNSITFENGELKSLDLSDAQVEKALVHNARIQLAKQRQQMMASLVLMGINRIVVTDGRISAKILYDFRARDRQVQRRSATAMDVARDRWGNVQTTRSGEGEWDNKSEVNVDKGDDEDKGGWDSSYYTKGKYKYENKPVITAQASAMTGSVNEIQTKVQLAGNVSVNFKSDYLPLEKMATPGMIAAIQGNSTPVDPNVLPSARQAPQAGSGNASGGSGSPAGSLPAPPNA